MNNYFFKFHEKHNSYIKNKKVFVLSTGSTFFVRSQPNIKRAA